MHLLARLGFRGSSQATPDGLPARVPTWLPQTRQLYHFLAASEPREHRQYRSTLYTGGSSITLNRLYDDTTMAKKAHVFEPVVSNSGSWLILHSTMLISYFEPTPTLSWTRAVHAATIGFQLLTCRQKLIQLSLHGCEKQKALMASSYVVT